MSKLKVGTKVIINYEKLEENYIGMIKKNKSLYMFDMNVALVQMSNEIEDMRKFDIENGEIRAIKSIAYNDFFGKKIPRYTLDNEYVFYKDELIVKE